MKNTLLMMPIMRSGTIVRTNSVATKNTAPVKASILARVICVSPTSTRRLSTASKVMLLGSRPSCSRISSIRRLRVTAETMRARMALGSKLLGLFIIGLTSIRGRRPDDGKLAFDSSIGQDCSAIKPSRSGNSGLNLSVATAKNQIRNSSIYSRPSLPSRRGIGPEDSRKGGADAADLTRSRGGDIGFPGTGIDDALLGQVFAIPPAAAERLKQGRGIAQARGARLHDLKGRLQIVLLCGEQEKNVRIAGLHLLLREIETCLGGTLEITRRFQRVGIIRNRVQ